MLVLLGQRQDQGGDRTGDAAWRRERKAGFGWRRTGDALVGQGDPDPGCQALAHQNGTAAWDVPVPRRGMKNLLAQALVGGLGPVRGQPAGVDGLGWARARSRLRRCTVTPKRSRIARRQAGVVSVGSASLRARTNATMAAD